MMRRSKLLALGVVLLGSACFGVLAGCGGAGKTSGTTVTVGAQTTTSSGTTTSGGSRLAVLSACAAADRAVLTMDQDITHLPTLSEVVGGTAINTLNRDDKAAIGAEVALRSLAVAAPDTAEVVRTYLLTTGQLKQGLRGLIASTENASRASTAISELLGAANETGPDQQALNQVCTG